MVSHTTHDDTHDTTQGVRRYVGGSGVEGRIAGVARPVELHHEADVEEGHALDLAVNEWLRPRLGTRGEVGSVGIRPEALSFTTSEAAVPSGSFRHRAEIGGILPTGGSWIIELKVDGRIVFATTTEAPTLRGGETVWLHARPTALHVFDKARNRLEEADAALQRAASGVAAVKGA